MLWESILYAVLGFFLCYFVGRLLMRGALDEIEHFMLKKYNKFKHEKNGTEEKKN